MISLVIPDLSLLEGKIFVGILGFSWASYMWEEYLSYRQRRVYRETIVPPKEVKEITDEETFQKARLYGIDKSVFGLIEGAFNQVFSTVVMLCGGLPAVWDISGDLVLKLGYEGESEIPQTVMFVTVGSVVSFFLSLPWAAYFTFKIEQKHGFNKQSPGFFIKDKIKKLCISQLITAPIIAGLVYIINIGGDYFFLYLWGFSTSVMLFFMTVYPDYIAPLFDKYEPLPEGSLKEMIEALAKRIQFPLTKLYVVEGSKRSAHSNAYFYGFFNNKRIVLYDTLLEDYTPLNKEVKEDATDVTEKKEDEKEPLLENDQKSEEEKEKDKKKKTGCNNDEVVAVLAHELGHWKLNHVLKGIVISEVNLLFMFLAFGSLYRYTPLYRAFGFHTQPAFIGLIIVMQYVFAPYSELLGFLMTMFSRHNEFQADAFACDLKHHDKLKSSLIKLNNDNLSFPIYDYLFSTWHHSHPPLLERIRAIEDLKRKSE